MCCTTNTLDNYNYNVYTHTIIRTCLNVALLYQCSLLFYNYITCKPACCAGGVDYSLRPDRALFPISVSSVQLSFTANCDQLEEENEDVVLSISVQPQDQYRVTVVDPFNMEVVILGKGQSLYTNYMLS